MPWDDGIAVVTFCCASHRGQDRGRGSWIGGLDDICDPWGAPRPDGAINLIPPRLRTVTRACLGKEESLKGRPTACVRVYIVRSLKAMSIDPCKEKEVGEQESVSVPCSIQPVRFCRLACWVAGVTLPQLRHSSGDGGGGGGGGDHVSMTLWHTLNCNLCAEMCAYVCSSVLLGSLLAASSLLRTVRKRKRMRADHRSNEALAGRGQGQVHDDAMPPFVALFFFVFVALFFVPVPCGASVPGWL